MNRFCRPAAAAALFMVLAVPPVFAQSQESTGAGLEARYEEAESFRRGVGVPRDLERALELHEALVDDGYRDSLVRVASISARLGRAEEAVAAYEAAIEAGAGFYAEVRYAAGHALGEFAELSRPEFGLEQLRLLAGQNDSPLPRYYLAQAIEERDGVTEEVISLYTTLAAEGDASSQSRLGQIYFEGTGVAEANAARAATYFRQAVEGGNQFATLRLAEALIASGDGQGALEAANMAVENGIEVAEIRRAMWHIEGDFGSSSDAAFGKSELARMAEEGQVDAARSALRMHERRSTRIEGMDLDAVIAKLEEAAASGNPAAVKVLARAYVQLYWLIDDNRERHAALIEKQGGMLSPSQAAAERVQAAYDPSSYSSSVEKVGAVLAEADDAGYVSGMMRLRSLEVKAFVQNIQQQLNTLDYGPCGVTGELSRCSLKAVMQFCSDEGLMESCIHGPMTYNASRRIVQALASKRSPPT